MYELIVTMFFFVDVGYYGFMDIMVVMILLWILDNIDVWLE